MDHRRVWRAAPATLAVVGVFVLTAAVAVPFLAYLVWVDSHAWVVPAVLGGLTVLALLYAWRFGLHPRLEADGTGVTVVNPFHTHRLDWDEVRVIAPGENGLVVASTHTTAEAWCVQKSGFATRRGRLTRADRIARELVELLDQHDPPWEDEATGLRVRRARPDESRMLTRLERAAGEDAPGRLAPADTPAYPVAEVTRRWRRLLRDPQMRTYVLERAADPVGFVSFDADTIRHIGVLPDHTGRGYGSALLELATSEIFDAGAAAANLWVPADSPAARGFCTARHWRETPDRRDGAFPPEPEIRLERPNPAAARRGRR